jgi:hypothetical protein
MKTKLLLALPLVVLIATASFGQKTATKAPVAAAAPVIHEVGNAANGLGAVFINGWSAGENEAVTFQKDNMGYVHIDGKAVIGSGSSVFTLPVGYRPKHVRSFMVPKHSGKVPPSYVRVKIDSDGTIQIGSSDATQAGEIISLDGLTVALF